MGNASSARKRVKVDDQYTRPQGLYPDRERDVDAKKLRRLILDGETTTLSLVPECSSRIMLQQSSFDFVDVQPQNDHSSRKELLCAQALG